MATQKINGVYHVSNTQQGGGGGSDPEAVKYTPQTLTEAQKSQARTNIGAADEINGITSATASVDNTTGTPSVSVNLSNQQLSLAFSGLKGGQGNTGSSVDYPYELVNNVTTDDATKGLSAAQGVVLQGELDQLGQEVDDMFQDSAADFEIQDENGNVLVQFANGGIRTKNFDSSKNDVIQKAVFLGDSITQGVYSYWNGGVHTDANRYNGFDITNMSSVEETTTYHGIPYYFGLLAKCETVNLAKRGTGYVTDPRNLGNAKVVAFGYDFSDTDFVALCFGVNDYIQGSPIGDISTKEAGTVIGNLSYILEKISTDNPLCKIVVFSPYNTWGQVSKGGDNTANYLYGDEAGNYALGHEINGSTLQDFVDAIDTVCQYYGVQHNALSKSNVVNRLTIKNIMIDGLHPSKESYIRLAAELYGKANFGN